MPAEFTIAIMCTAWIGLGALARGLYLQNKLRATQNWQQTTGTLTKAEIVSLPSADSTDFSIRVQYEYSVNGARYTGKRIGLSGGQYSRKKRAERELERYPVNSSVVVYFDPEKPADAVLVREAPDRVIYIVGGIVMLGIVVAGLLYHKP